MGGGLGVGQSHLKMGVKVGLEDGEGLGVVDMLGEGAPEPASCPGERSVAKTAEFCCVGGEETG